MPINVQSPSADRREQIANAASVLGKSVDRKKVFSAIYAGKKKIKTAREISRSTLLTEIRTLQEGKRLAAEDIVRQVKVKGLTAYEKIDFYSHNKNTILRFSNDKKKLQKYPTRSNPQIQPGTVKVVLSKKIINIKQVHIDDIDSFHAIKKIKLESTSSISVYEKDVKKLLKNVIGEKNTFKDWGGEPNDLFTTKMKYLGKRITAAFALKGKATKGKLVLKKMGKNGDQIQRLFKSPADIFLVQYNGEIDQSILEEMKTYATMKSVMEQRKIFFGVIDGADTARLIQAYKKFL